MLKDLSINEINHNEDDYRRKESSSNNLNNEVARIDFDDDNIEIYDIDKSLKI